MEQDSTGRYQQVKRIVMEALDHQGRAREEWIAGQCRGDATLEAEVRSLLADMEGDATLAISVESLAVPVAVPPQPDLSGQDASAQAPREYRLLRRLGAGGMGVVYLAERSDGGFTQRVALKLLNAVAEASPELRERFARERALLARLDHPGIARLLDGGILGDGRPFLAMEYVEGERIDVHAARLPLQQRIALFLKVCDAVADAHRCLVIHRDLKPANILVDARGEPKLLDFGIARLIDEGDVAAARTETGQHALTLAYASPEQVACAPLTTATDVYSLGAVLYQLVCGSAPFADADTPAGLYQAIINTDVTPPSRRLPERGDSTSPRDRGAAVPGDVDAIVLKALRKEPAQRYASVAALADDLRRYLARRPVQAQVGKRWYRVRRFVQRNLWAIAASTAVAVSIIGGLVASLAALERAKTQQAMAEERGIQLQRIVEFQRSMLESVEIEAMGRSISDAQLAAVLAGDPALDRAQLEQAFARVGATDIARDALETYVVTHALDRIARDVADDPTLATELRQSLARVLHAIGSNSSAERQLQQVVEQRQGDATATADSLLSAKLDLARVRTILGMTDEAEKLFVEVRDATTARAPADTLRLGADMGLATLMIMQGRFADAIADYDRLRDQVGTALPDSDERMLTMRRYRIDALIQDGRRDEAATELEALLPVMVATLGPTHRDTLYVTLVQAKLLRELKQFERSQALAIEAADVLARRYGESHPETVSARYLVAINGTALSNDEAGLALVQQQIERVIDFRRQSQGADSPQAVSPMTGLVAVITKRARLAESPQQETALLQQAVGVQRQILQSHLQHRGADHPNTLMAHGSLASLLHRQGDNVAALEQARICLDGQRRVLDADHPIIAGTLDMIGDIQRELGRLDDARQSHAAALEQRLRVLGTQAPNTLESATRLYEVLRLQGRTADAQQVRTTHLDPLLALDPATLDAAMNSVRDEALRTIEDVGDG